MDMISVLQFENEKLNDEKADIRDEAFADKKQLELRLKILEKELEDQQAMLVDERNNKAAIESELHEVNTKMNLIENKNEELTAAFKKQMERLEKGRNVLQSAIDFPNSNTNFNACMMNVADEMSDIVWGANAQMNCLQENCIQTPVCPVTCAATCAATCPATCAANCPVRLPMSTHNQMYGTMQRQITALNQKMINLIHENRDLEKKNCKILSKLQLLEKDSNCATLENKNLLNHMKDMFKKLKRKILADNHSALNTGGQPALKTLVDEMRMYFEERDKLLTYVAMTANEKHKELLKRHHKLLSAYKDLYNQMKQNCCVNWVDLGLIEEYLKFPDDIDICADLDHPVRKSKDEDIIAAVRKDIQDIHRRIDQQLLHHEEPKGRKHHRRKSPHDEHHQQPHPPPYPPYPPYPPNLPQPGYPPNLPQTPYPAHLSQSPYPTHLIQSECPHNTPYSSYPPYPDYSPQPQKAVKGHRNRRKEYQSLLGGGGGGGGGYRRKQKSPQPQVQGDDFFLSSIFND